MLVYFAKTGCVFFLDQFREIKKGTGRFCIWKVREILNRSLSKSTTGILSQHDVSAPKKEFITRGKSMQHFKIFFTDCVNHSSWLYKQPRNFCKWERLFHPQNFAVSRKKGCFFTLKMGYIRFHYTIIGTQMLRECRNWGFCREKRIYLTWIIGIGLSPFDCPIIPTHFSSSSPSW